MGRDRALPRARDGALIDVDGGDVIAARGECAAQNAVAAAEVQKRAFGADIGKKGLELLGRRLSSGCSRGRKTPNPSGYRASSDSKDSR